MLYSVITHADLATFRLHSEEKWTNYWISTLPQYNETIGYELREGVLVVKFEEADSERVTYMDVAYRLTILSQMAALACALHNRKIVQVGSSRYDVHIAVNHPQGLYITEQVGSKLINHQRNGVVFLREDDFYVAVEEATIAAIMERQQKYSLPQVMSHDWLVRFEVEGRFIYKPMAHIFGKDIGWLIEAGKQIELNWAEKFAEITKVVEEYTP